jgi:hypothetical protein
MRNTYQTIGIAQDIVNNYGPRTEKDHRAISEKALGNKGI